MDPAWLLAQVIHLVFLCLVLVMCLPAIDFVRERSKRIKRKKQQYEDRIGWILLICVILCFMTKC